MQAFSRWVAEHPNGRLAAAGLALWAIPAAVAFALLSMTEVADTLAPQWIATPILLVAYLANIVMAFVAVACRLAALVIIPFAGWRACRDYRSRKATAIEPTAPDPQRLD